MNSSMAVMKIYGYTFKERSSCKAPLNDQTETPAVWQIWNTMLQYLYIIIIILASEDGALHTRHKYADADYNI